jgi:hypothetical protein
MGSTARKTAVADLQPMAEQERITAHAENGQAASLPPIPVGTGPLLPLNLSLTERAAAAFRRWLAERGHGDWAVFHTGDDELYDVENHLPDLIGEGEEVPTWEHAPPLTETDRVAEQPLVRNEDNDAVRPGELFSPGFLLVEEAGVAVARWYWVDPEYNTADSLWLAACSSAEAYDATRDRIKELRHRGNLAVWQIVRGSASHDGPRVRRRRNAGKELIVGEALQKQIDRDLLGFFTPKVKRLYKRLGVPYRRGVLLHGPPGNGKTSVIRMIGGRLPKIPFLLLRPDRQINGGALRAVIDRWQRQAPAALVIEDLNWLLEQVDVSQFLNLIDGIERASAGGLLLIATTNYPEKLDPAVNNRPGRFDVVIELPNPDEALRYEFFAKNLGKAAKKNREEPLAEDVLQKAAKDADRLSFAHLREVLRLSGLLAIEEGRESRTGEDVLKAVGLVWDGHDRAVRGFPKPPEVPFGLQHPRRDGGG